MDASTPDDPGRTSDDPEVEYAREQIEELCVATYPTGEQQCDMIMKGGITSGVVYPLTICRLATRYRLRSIGGTSAGAIAAGVAAAAEYRRQTGSNADDRAEGYRTLATLPREISTRLESLFQPMPETRRIYGVLFAAVDPAAGKLGKARAIAGRIVSAAPWWFVAGVGCTLAVVLPGLVVTSGFPISGSDWWRFLVGAALPLLLALAVGLVTALVGFSLAVGRVLPATLFGLTDGGSHDGTPGLTDWLADKIDEIAGVGSGACLTLGDLWGADAVDTWTAGHAAGFVGVGPESRIRSKRTIDLQVMTTDLTLRRPFRLPFESQAFLFSRTEMAALFPERVVAAITSDDFLSEHLHPDTGEPLHWFPGPGTADRSKPGPDHLPVIVMVRMSLSFPGLISAVPLYAIDFNGDQSVVRHVFSDGGVSSNFPMQFFDALLPTRPTFGVNLAPPHPLYPDSTVWRPAPTSGGIIPRAQPVDGLGGFVGALRDTMQNWADNKQITQRCYADRVVEIRLAADEGGMNLRMPDTRVLKLVARGASAGESLLEFQWDPHRLIRYRSTMARLDDVLDRMRAAWAAPAAPYGDLVTDYPSGGVASSYVGAAPWRAADVAATDQLMQVVDGWNAAGWPALQQSWPEPAPDIRPVPE